MTRTRRVALLVLSTVVVLTAPVAAGTAAPASDSGSVAPVAAVSDGHASVSGHPTATAGTIELTKELSLTPDRPGEIGVTYRFTMPEEVAEFTAQLPEDAEVTGTRGFSEGADGYEWNERLSNPSITFRQPANVKKEAVGPIADDGQYQFVDKGDWALVRVPWLEADYSVYDDVEFVIDETVDGEGAAGDRITYLGPVREYTHTASGQTFRLVVPERATLAEDRGDIFASVSEAADTLRIGDKDDTVFMVAAPGEDADWAVQGLQTGEADFWVRDGLGVDSSENVWVHEYVHTRQDYDSTTETRWFTEASATWYAASLSLGQDRIDFAAFRDRMEYGERGEHADATLSEPSSWAGTAPYTKGALVAGQLDRRIRLASDGRSLQDVFREMNGEGSTVTNTQFRRQVRQSGDSDVATYYDRYVTTSAEASMWSSSAHQRAFDQPLAYFSYALPGDDSGVAVSGPYREGALESTDPATVATGETVHLTVAATNDGSTEGTYDATLRVNGVAQETQSGTLTAGASESITFEFTPEQPGSHVLSVDDVELDVEASAPGVPTVAGLEADRDSVTVGESVGVTATLENDEAVPATGNVTLLQDGEAVETRTVVVGPTASATERFERTLSAAGTVEFRIGDRRTTVSVAEETSAEQGSSDSGTDSQGSADQPRGSEESTTTAIGDGFGAVPAVLALALLVGARIRRS